MIELKQVSKRYSNGFEALKQVSFEIAKGEMVFITGHSGAGKSTILKLIAGIEPCSHGVIKVAQQNLQQLSPSKVARLRSSMGIVLQHPHLLDDRTVFANVALPLDIEAYRPQEQAKRVRAALDKVGLLSKERLYPQSLSAGEQQRVSIARALVNKPGLLLADEPTGNLDPELSLDIMRLFEEFNQVGVTVLIASHDVTLLARFKHRVLKLDKGMLSADSGVNQYGL